MVRPPIRERLTAAALELFDERGYEHTTVDDIAARAGVGRTTFFRAFGSKEDVVFPHHEQVLVAVRDRLAAATPETAPVAVVEAVRLVLRHYLAEGAVARTRYRLTSSVPALRAREIATMQQYQRLFRGYIASWLGGGPGTDLRAELAANLVVTAHNFVLRRWLRGMTGDAEHEFEAAMAEVTQMLRLGGSPSTPEAGAAASIVVFRTDRELGSVLPELRRILDG